MEGRYAGTLYEAFQRTALEHPARTAVIYLGHRYSYQTILELTERFAASLLEIGVKRGERVILYLPNTPQWFISFFGVLRAGGVAVPVTPIYTHYDLEYIIRDSGAGTVVCTDTNFGYVRRAVEGTGLKRVVYTRITDLLPLYKRVLGALFDRVPSGRVARGMGIHPFNALLGRSPSGFHEIKGGTGSDTAYLLYTGGTTGFPRGVPGTHRFFLASTLEMKRIYGERIAEGEHRLLLGVPLFHIMGQLITWAACFHAGNTVLLQPGTHIDAMLEAIQRHRATLFIGVPTLYRMILENERLNIYDMSSLRYCFTGGDVLPPEVFRQWKERFGLAIYQIYGSTEVSTVSVSPLHEEPRPGSVGIPLSGRRVKVVDPITMEEVPEASEGELLVSAEDMMEGYWKKPEETERAFVRAGGLRWYRTGDMVKMDEEGYLYFLDRGADMIKHKGYRIAAAEIEVVLQEHPNVVGACAVGVPDPVLGERVKAFVILKEDVRGGTAHDLIRWCRERLPSYKVPDYIEFRDMLPKSKVGKLLRREIREGERKRFK